MLCRVSRVTSAICKKMLVENVRFTKMCMI
jgi:hypothetical protein